MITNSFQTTEATLNEVLTTASMLLIKGGTDDKRAPRPVKAVGSTKSNNGKKP